VSHDATSSARPAAPPSAQLQAGIAAYERGEFLAALRAWREASLRGEAAADYCIGQLYDKGEGVEGSIPDAVAWYTQAAGGGHVEAQYRLGLIYRHGAGGGLDSAGSSIAQMMFPNGTNVARDPLVAFRWLAKAAEAGNGEAQVVLGDMLSAGEGCSEDLVCATRWYTAAARQNLAAAQFALGEVCFHGRGIAENLDMALHWYQLAAAQNHGRAVLALGMMYLHGKGVAKDRVEAARLFASAAVGNDAIALYSMGLLHLKGDGVTEDSERGESELRESARLGYVPARIALGELYTRGGNGEPDLREAAHWYESAAELGDAQAQFLTGQFYEAGEGVAPSEREAAKWFLRAAESGHSAAAFRIATCYGSGRGVEKDVSRSIAWFEVAAQGGIQAAQIQLGRLYADETCGIECDHSRAAYWFEQAVSGGDPEAKLDYALFLLESEKSQVSHSRAVELLTEAAAAGYGPASRQLESVRRVEGREALRAPSETAIGEVLRRLAGGEGSTDEDSKAGVRKSGIVRSDDAEERQAPRLRVVPSRSVDPGVTETAPLESRAQKSAAREEPRVAVTPTAASARREVAQKSADSKVEGQKIGARPYVPRGSEVSWERFRVATKRRLAAQRSKAELDRRIEGESAAAKSHLPESPGLAGKPAVSSKLSEAAPEPRAELGCHVAGRKPDPGPQQNENRGGDRGREAAPQQPGDAASRVRDQKGLKEGPPDGASAPQDSGGLLGMLAGLAEKSAGWDGKSARQAQGSAGSSAQSRSSSGPPGPSGGQPPRTDIRPVTWSSDISPSTSRPLAEKDTPVLAAAVRAKSKPDNGGPDEVRVGTHRRDAAGMVDIRDCRSASSPLSSGSAKDGIASGERGGEEPRRKGSEAPAQAESALVRRPQPTAPEQGPVRKAENAGKAGQERPERTDAGHREVGSRSSSEHKGEAMAAKPAEDALAVSEPGGPDPALPAHSAGSEMAARHLDVAAIFTRIRSITEKIAANRSSAGREASSRAPQEGRQKGGHIGVEQDGTLRKASGDAGSAATGGMAEADGDDVQAHSARHKSGQNPPLQGTVKSPPQPSSPHHQEARQGGSTTTGLKPEPAGEPGQRARAGSTEEGVQHTLSILNALDGATEALKARTFRASADSAAVKGGPGSSLAQSEPAAARPARRQDQNEEAVQSEHPPSRGQAPDPHAPVSNAPVCDGPDPDLWRGRPNAEHARTRQDRTDAGQGLAASSRQGTARPSADKPEEATPTQRLRSLGLGFGQPPDARGRPEQTDAGFSGANRTAQARPAETGRQAQRPPQSEREREQTELQWLSSALDRPQDVRREQARAREPVERGEGDGILLAPKYRAAKRKQPLSATELEEEEYADAVAIRRIFQRTRPYQP